MSLYVLNKNILGFGFSERYDPDPGVFSEGLAPEMRANDLEPLVKYFEILYSYIQNISGRIRFLTKI